MPDAVASTATQAVAVADDQAVADSYEPSRLLAMLKAEAAAAPAPDALPDFLPLSAITCLQALFQPRGMLDNHVHELAGIAKSGRMLEALEVIQIGQTAYLVDGHHRMEAYRRAKVVEPVPVTYFAGTIEEAVLESGRANSRAKLTMSNQERQDYAWRLVKMGGYKGAQIIAASSISLRQVAAMRKVLKALGEEAFDCDAWWKARNLAVGKAGLPLSDDELEERLEAQAIDYANRMAKTFSTKLAQNPELAARALNIYFGRNLPELVSHLRDFVGGGDDPDETLWEF